MILLRQRFLTSRYSFFPVSFPRLLALLAAPLPDLIRDLGKLTFLTFRQSLTILDIHLDIHDVLDSPTNFSVYYLFSSLEALCIYC
jgi:hypothetical protein